MNETRGERGPMWGLSLANFVALVFGGGAVIALYISATDADKRIAKANERASAAAERAAALEKEAAELRLALARLKAPRNLDDAQQARIIAKLTPLGGKPYELATPVNLEPGSNITQELVNVLSKRAGNESRCRILLL